MKTKLRQISHREQGLSLIELLVTIMILALLSRLLWNSYQQVSRFQALQSASAATGEWLMDVRKRAMQKNRACSIVISPSDSTLRASSTSACGSFPALDLSAIGTGSTAIRFCYRNTDPIQINTSTAACNSDTSNSNAVLTFSPRGTNRLNAVLEFFTGTEQARTCTLVIQPNGLIRYGTVKSGSCQTNG